MKLDFISSSDINWLYRNIKYIDKLYYGNFGVNPIDTSLNVNIDIFFNIRGVKDYYLILFNRNLTMRKGKEFIKLINNITGK